MLILEHCRSSGFHYWRRKRLNCPLRSILGPEPKARASKKGKSIWFREMKFIFHYVGRKKQFASKAESVYLLPKYGKMNFQKGEREVSVEISAIKAGFE